MTTAQVVEMSVTVNNNNPIQDYDHLDDQTQLTYEMTPGFNPFAVLVYKGALWLYHSQIWILLLINYLFIHLFL